MKYALLALSMGAAVTKNMVSRAGKAAFGSGRGMLRANMATAALGLVVFAVSGLNFSFFSADILLLAALYGLLTLLSQTLHIIAVRTGPVSVCSLIYASGFLIPAIFSTIAYGEPFSLGRGLGVALLLFSIVLVSAPSASHNGKMWLLPAFGAMAATGGVGVLQKLFRAAHPEAGMNEFLFAAFGAMLLISLALYPAFRESSERVKGAPLMTLILAVTMVTVNKLNLYLSGALPGAVFFPCINGGNMALTAVAAAIVFKEKLKPSQIAGVVGAAAAIVLIAVL